MKISFHLTLPIVRFFMNKYRHTITVALAAVTLGLGGCGSFGLFSYSNSTVERSGPVRNLEALTGRAKILALEQKKIDSRLQGKEHAEPNITQSRITVHPLIGVDSQTLGLKVDQLIWACEGSYPASVNPEIGKYGCASYISGFIDSVILVQFLLGKKLICFPKEEISKELAVKSFLRWGRGHPESHNENARSALIVMFAKKYPCIPK